MTIEYFLTSLEGVKNTNRGYAFRCPAHDDRHPSATAVEGEDGRILIHCWAGCTAAEIVAAMGLTLADLFPHSRKPHAEIQREQEQRLRRKAAAETARQQEGLRIDALREAAYFIGSRKGMEIESWRDEEVDQELFALAIAYGLLEGESAYDVR
jgi:hypothetical protein